MKERNEKRKDGKRERKTERHEGRKERRRKEIQEKDRGMRETKKENTKEWKKVGKACERNEMKEDGCGSRSWRRVSEWWTTPSQRLVHLLECISRSTGWVYLTSSSYVTALSHHRRFWRWRHLPGLKDDNTAWTNDVRCTGSVCMRVHTYTHTVSVGVTSPAAASLDSISSKMIGTTCWLCEVVLKLCPLWCQQWHTSLQMCCVFSL